MKQLWVPLVLALALALGCSQAPVPATAVLVGAHDMVLVDTLLFTTSTDRDELRVLDLAPASGTQGVRPWVRGPNPLEALSIPVLARPSALSRDTRYETSDAGVPLGREVGGPWVYATRAGGSEISVVAAGPASDPAQLVEVKRIPTAAPVTASAGARVSPGLSRLYFATWDGTTGALQSSDLPGTVPELKARAPGELTAQVKPVLQLADGVIIDLVVVPGLPGRGICEDPSRECLVVATRTMQGRAGTVLLVDPRVPIAVRELRFPGPVRLLAVHPGTRSGTRELPPGERVFGILDEEACGGPECGGVIAVDTFTGEVASDFSGLPMLPIRTGASLATGLSVVAGGARGLSSVLELPAAGVITTSNGSFIFFDADQLVPIDLDPAPTVVRPFDIGLYRPNGELNKGDGGFPDYVAGPVVYPEDGGTEVTLASGAWRPQAIEIVVNGLIPGLENLPSASTTEFPAPPELLSRVLPGDTLVRSSCPPTADGGQPADARSTVAEVTAGSLKASSPLCPGATFGVRAGDTKPYVVTATGTGFLDRAEPNQRFEYVGSYFQRIPGQFVAGAPTFSVLLGPEVPTLEEDWRWRIEVQPAERPLALRVSSQKVGCSTNVASSVVWDVDRNAVFSVFPSGNGIVELDPSLATDRTDLTGNCWR